jgi:arylsulfatase A-like enzyme
VPVVTSDFYPTILAAVGLPLPDNQVQPLDGISVLPLLEGKMTARPKPIGFMAGETVALSDNRYKLVVGGAKGKLESVALYDLVEDLGERKNLAAEKPEIVARMRPALEAWKASVERSATGADYARPLP